MSKILRDENSGVTKIDALIEIKTEGFIPSTHNQSVAFEGCDAIFALFGTSYDFGMQEYALAAAGPYGDPDLNKMMGWLAEEHPEVFNDLLRAVLQAVNEEDLDEALEDIGWSFEPDVSVLFDYDRLVEELGEEPAGQFIDELCKSLATYLIDIGLADLLIDITVRVSDAYVCPNCGYREEDDDDGLDGDSGPNDGNSVLTVGVSDELSAEGINAQGLEDRIIEEVVLPLLQKYDTACAPPENAG
ncbi:MAG: hypothetical protein LBT19_01880 [Candidatus Nomurabacteria bacterium]|jgi:hypothetical protein|nr:hypothetical protein [Candidatus Nomurabacteria bacterium]